MSAVVAELCEALEKEIVELKRGRGGSRVSLIDGRRLQQAAEAHIYEFTCSDESAVLGDDTPAQLQVGGQPYDATVVTRRGQAVELAVARDLGPVVPAAQLTVSLWFLYEALRKKLADGREADRFQLSDIVFGLRKPAALPSTSTPVYSTAGNTPNPSQEDAIKASFRSPLNLIWGPPGTGKTATVARAIGAHLNAGRRVLLVSHANNAVDEALESVARQLEGTPFYRDGRLVRLGIPQEEKLKLFKEHLPLVLEEEIAATRGAKLRAEIDRIRAQSQQARIELAAAAGALQLIGEVATVTERERALAGEVTRGSANLAVATSHVDEERRKLADAERSLSDTLTAKGIGGFVRRLGVDRLRQRIAEQRVQVDAALAQVESHRRRLDTTTAERERVAARLAEARCRLAETLKQLGASESNLAGQRRVLEEQVRVADAIIDDLQQQLANARKSILSEARLVATTLTKTYISPFFPDEPFDVLVVDESSMAPLPALYWAASRCRTHATIVGDFLQLPPVVISDAEMAKRWLGRSIYDVLGIFTVDQASRDPRVVLLNTQYRMHPDISHVANHTFYGGKLCDAESVKDYRFEDGVADRSLVLVDTTPVDAWCTRLSSGSRINPTHAAVSVGIARTILQRSPKATIGIASPYAAQARLIQKLLRDEKLAAVRASTVHRFQGSEVDVVIFDLTEGPGATVGRLTDDTKTDSDAQRLLNVAITRAKHRLYIVAHVKRLKEGLPRHAKLAEILVRLGGAAQLMPATTFLPAPESSPSSPIADGDRGSASSFVFYDANHFWPLFIRDVELAEHRLIIESPFITERRWSELEPVLRGLRHRGVETVICTRPPIDHRDNMADEATRVISACASMGITVVERQQMHEKLAIVDTKTAWHGSLNILSHRNTSESMARFTGSSVADLVQIAQDHLREHKRAAGAARSANGAGPICPTCGRSMVLRSGSRGQFWGCSGFARWQCKTTLPYP